MFGYNAKEFDAEDQLGLSLSPMIPKRGKRIERGSYLRVGVYSVRLVRNAMVS